MFVTRPLERSVAQLVIEKLDLNRITVTEAKNFLQANCGISVRGQSREKVANSLNQLLRDQRRLNNDNAQYSLLLESPT